MRRSFLVIGSFFIMSFAMAQLPFSKKIYGAGLDRHKLTAKQVAYDTAEGLISHYDALCLQKDGFSTSNLKDVNCEYNEHINHWHCTVDGHYFCGKF